jgi:DNA-binding CsgD family transcriptional regulator/tetratricopeptide (TPR) repeat protein
MLETVREFGLERLETAGEAGTVRAAHAAFYQVLADEAAAPGADEPAGFDRLEAELANFRAALAWSCAGHAPDTALRLAVRLERLWFRIGLQQEGRDWLERSLAAAPDAPPALRTAALNGRGEWLRELGQRTDALRLYEMARELARASGDRAGEATALTGLSALANDVSDYVAQRPLNERSIAIWRELGDRRGLARALHTLAWAEAGFGNVEAAMALFREALSHARAAGDDRWTARSLDSLGNMLLLQSDFAAARPLLEEGLAVARANRDRHELAVIAADLGMVTLELGDVAAARAHFAEAVALVYETGRRRLAAFLLVGCAVLADVDGQPARALRLMGAARAMRDEMDSPLESDFQIAAMAAAGKSSVVRTLLHLAAAATGAGVWSMDEALREAAAVARAPVDPGASPAGVVAPKTPALRLGLTPREVDVLRLLAEGRSDRAIADALFISHRTASKHVGAILAKLGAASRAEAAARAVRDGLT